MAFRIGGVGVAKIGGEGSGNRGPDQVDVHVGKRIRLRRKMLGLTQQDLAARVSISFQQVQKYENGLNRISASRLYDVARILGVPVDFFYSDLPIHIIDSRPGVEAGAELVVVSPDGTAAERDPLRRRETLKLVRGFWALRSEDHRRSILDLVDTLARAQGGLDG